MYLTTGKEKNRGAVTKKKKEESKRTKRKVRATRERKQGISENKWNC